MRAGARTCSRSAGSRPITRGRSRVRSSPTSRRYTSVCVERAGRCATGSAEQARPLQRMPLVVLLLLGACGTKEPERAETSAPMIEVVVETIEDVAPADTADTIADTIDSASAPETSA